MSTDVGYGISAKFRIDDSDLAKLERRLTGISKSISGIKTSLVDALYGREVRSALDQLERRLGGVVAKAAHAGRMPTPGGAPGGAYRGRAYGPVYRPGMAEQGWGLEAPWSWRRARTFYGGDRAGGVPPPPPWDWQGPRRPPPPRQIGGPVTPMPQYGSWQSGWSGFGHPAPEEQYGPIHRPFMTSKMGPIGSAGEVLAAGTLATGALAGGAALHGAKAFAENAISTQREAEMGRQGITAALAAFAGVPIGDAQTRSSGIYSKLERAAAIGPGETSDYAFGFQRVFGPLAQRGATDDQIMSLVSQSIAGGSMLWGSAGAKFGPMDIMQALTSGLTDRTTPLASMAVQAAGFTGKQFDEADSAGKLRMLIAGFDKLQPALDVLSKTVDAQEHTFSDAMKRMVRTISDPAYEIYRLGLIETNTALSTGNGLRQDEIESVRNLVTGMARLTKEGVTGFMEALDSSRSAMKAPTDAWTDTMATATDATKFYSDTVGVVIGQLAAAGSWLVAKQVQWMLWFPAMAGQLNSAGDSRSSVPGMPMMGGMGMPHDLRITKPHRMEGEVQDYGFSMVADTPGAEWGWDEYGPPDMRGAAQKAKAAVNAGSGRNREIVIRIEDFKVDITEPRAIARSYKRVVADAVTQLARSGMDTAVDGVAL